MYKRLSNFLETNKILYKYQFGFRKNHSTSQAVMEVVDKIYQYCDNREVTTGIFLDLQKAFDTVNHPVLIEQEGQHPLTGQRAANFRRDLEPT